MANYTTTLPAQAAAGATVTQIIGDVSTVEDADTNVQHVVVTPPPGFTTVTGQPTNNATISVRQLRGGAPLATVSTVTLGAGTNLTAETPLDLPLTGFAELAQDDVLDVQVVQNGTGLALGAGLIVEVEVN